MRLYLIHFHGSPWHVEAPTMEAAVRVWKQVAAEWQECYEGDEEPESIALLHDNGDDPAVFRYDHQNPLHNPPPPEMSPCPSS